MEMLQPALQTMANTLATTIAQALVPLNPPWGNHGNGVQQPPAGNLITLENCKPPLQDVGPTGPQQLDAQLDESIAAADGADEELMLGPEEGEQGVEMEHDASVASVTDRIIRRTRENALMKRPATKRPAATCPSAPAKGLAATCPSAPAKGRQTVAKLKHCKATTCDIEGWSCWQNTTAGRMDKYYVRNADGLLCRSRREVRNAMEKRG